MLYEATAEGMEKLRKDYAPRQHDADEDEDEDEAPPPLSPDLDLRDESVGLSIRAGNVCAVMGLRSLKDLSHLEERTVLRMRGAGRKTLAELRSALARAGLNFLASGNSAEARRLIIRLVHAGGGTLPLDLVAQANAWLAKQPRPRK